MIKTSNITNWLSRLIKGMILALGFILPGVSGGVLAAILGIYERLLQFMGNVRQRFKLDFWYFVPVGLGGLLGIVLLSAPLEYLLEKHQILVLWAFSGAIIGTLPSLFKTAGVQGRKTSDWMVLILTTVLGGWFLYNLSTIFGTLKPNFASWILAGGLIALGIILPGLSPSNLLLYLGLFEPMLKGFKSGDLSVLIPMIIGAGITLLALSKVMLILLKKFYAKVYHFILGIVIASIGLILVPPVANYEGINIGTMVFALILMLAGMALGWWMSQLENKYK
ncbi:integral membrane protein [Weissella koreensis KACC 15510]|nr:integral membrane protein [Weissella koreensis KACC 15510]